MCFREVQKSLKQSAKFLIESKLAKFGLGEAQGFKIFTDRIQTPGDGVFEFTGMQDHTADSVKSYEGFHRAWGEEAQSISSHSLTLLRPTIRWEDKQRGLISELRFSWNPRRKTDAVDQLLRGDPPPGAVVTQANHSDNPWFPDVLEEERRNDMEKRPEEYAHIWEGDYATVNSGAYFARDLLQAKAEGRIGNVPRDPLLEVRAYWDIGGTGARADATAIWLVQFVGPEIRWLDHYEAVGQPLSAHVDWLRSHGYPVRTCVLPHDGANHEKVYSVSYESALREAGFEVIVIPNQGRGAAKKRIDALRRLFPACRFNAETTESGRDALAWYHERRDDQRQVGLGPEHDWSSHSADAAGLVAIAHADHGPKLKLPEFVPRQVY